jgi:hypothetical protein
MIGFRLVNKVLFRIISNILVPVVEDAVTRRALIYQAHEDSGHLALESCFDLLKTRMYHPRMYDEVKLAIESCEDWDRMMPAILRYHRARPHSATGVSPFEVVFGQQLRINLDIPDVVKPNYQREMSLESLRQLRLYHSLKGCIVSMLTNCLLIF